MQKTTIVTYHILNGDCLADQLKQTNIKGEYIVCRECLIDGALGGDTLSEFWATRSKYISDTYKETTENYFHKAVTEFERMSNLPDNSEVCLWFENDLFCQRNMWFILSLISNRPTPNKVFRVFPTINNKANLWKGFGISNSKMLEQSYLVKVPFNPNDIELGNNLWNAYKGNYFNKLIELSLNKSECFQYLEEVCKAHIDRFPINGKMGRPENAVREIIETKTTDFKELFSEFSKREGIYGFGDLQVKNIYRKQMHSH